MPPDIPAVASAAADHLPPDLTLSFIERFLTRRDTYAVQQADGRYQRIAAPMGRDTLHAHLTGAQTLALYALDRQRQARWLCLDDDMPDGLAHLFVLQQALAALGLTTLREASRRGGHLWLLCSQSIPAALLRGVALSVLALLTARGDLPDQVAHAIEVYPSASALGAGGYSQAVRVPFGVHQRTGQMYPFVEAGARPAHGLTVVEGLRWFLAQPVASPTLIRAASHRLERQLEEALDTVALALDASLAPLVLPVRPAGDQGETSEPRLADLGSGRASLIAWVNSHVDLPELITETTPAVQLRPMGEGFGGWCPFHDDRGDQGDGKPGTPSLYVVRNWRYGWSWRCYSTNCGAYRALMQHTFDWLVWLSSGDVQWALSWVRTRYGQRR
jgi:hypothetical protein